MRKLVKRNPYSISSDVFRINGLDDYFTPFYQPFWRADNKSLQAKDLKSYQKDGHYIVHLEIPEYKDEDVDISVNEGVVSISGQYSKEEDNSGYKKTITGSYSYQFTLPNDVEYDKLEASYKDGRDRKSVV